MGVRTANVQPGNIGETIEGLASTIHARRDASPDESYTARLLTDVEDELLKRLPKRQAKSSWRAKTTTMTIFAMRRAIWCITCL